MFFFKNLTFDLRVPQYKTTTNNSKSSIMVLDNKKYSSVRDVQFNPFIGNVIASAHENGVVQVCVFVKFYEIL